MDNPVLQIVMRYLHVVSAILLVGAWAYMIFAVLPSVRLLEDSLRKSVTGLIHQRCSKLLWTAIAGLLVSGVFNWVANARTYRAMGPKANALIGTKVLLALVLFVIVWLHSTGFGKGRGARFWLMLKLHLAAVIILLAGVLRYYRLEHLKGLAG